MRPCFGTVADHEHPRAKPGRVPGSFDPVTNGHLDIVGRASRLFDEVIVAVLVNQSKPGLFTSTSAWRCCARSRKACTTTYGSSRSEGLLVDFCRTAGREVVVKGLRAVSDFDYELQMAQMNIGLAGVETLFMPTNPLYSFLSSSLVKDVAKWGGDVSPHVPECGGPAGRAARRAVSPYPWNGNRRRITAARPRDRRVTQVADVFWGRDATVACCAYHAVAGCGSAVGRRPRRAGPS